MSTITRLSTPAYGALRPQPQEGVATTGTKKAANGTPPLPQRISERAQKVASKFRFGRLVDGPRYTGHSTRPERIDVFGNDHWAFVYEKGSILFTPAQGLRREKFEVTLRGNDFEVVGLSGEHKSAPISSGLMEWAQAQEGTVEISRVVGGGAHGEKNIYYLSLIGPNETTYHVVRASGRELT